MGLESDLAELEFTGIEMVWNPSLKVRAEKMIDEYGEDLSIIIQYVVHGGVKDFSDFYRGYDKLFQYRTNNGWPLPAKTPEEYKKKVKKTMLEVALSDENNFIYCPFAKTRLNNVLKSQSLFNADWDFFKDVFCYIYQGVHLEDFKFDEKKEKERKGYLRRIMILD